MNTKLISELRTYGRKISLRPNTGCGSRKIVDKVINFTHKSGKYILDHLKKQRLCLTNTKRKEKLEETVFLWNP